MKQIRGIGIFLINFLERYSFLIQRQVLSIVVWFRSHETGNEMCKEAYLIKDNGICYASYNESEESNPIIGEDLKTSMLIGLDYGINEAFNNKIKCMILENEKRIYFNRYCLNEMIFNLVLVFDGNRAPYVDLEDRIDELKDFMKKDDKYCNLQDYKVDQDSFGLNKKLKELFGTK